MGLTNDYEPLNLADSPFVAVETVEFDIFSNEWDSPGEHVGIGINSMLTIANVSWQESRTLLWEGELMKLGLVIILLLII
jgi:hypothetical protein